jgi:predicted acyltransferase
MITDVQQQPAERLESLDVLRGFDMFWIVGGGQMIHALAHGTSHPWLKGLAGQFEHFQWEGFCFYDLIMPLFLFMIGVSMPYSFGKRLQRGDRRGGIFLHVLFRVVVLCVLGMMVNGRLLTYDPSKFQLTYSVLHVLAMGYLVASLLVLTLKPRWQLPAVAVMLAIYWVVQTYVPAPGQLAGTYAERSTMGDWINDWLLGDWQGEWRRPWIISLTTYGTTAMLGVFAGQLLRSGRSNWQKVGWLVAWGLLCLAAGWAWSFQVPIIKKTWTTTYTLVAGGWSYLLLAAFYTVIDVWRLRRWAFPFKVIGMNAITAYMVCHLFSPALRQVAKVFVEGLKQYVGAGWYPSLETAATFGVLWLLLYGMYRTRVFVKI